MDRADDITRFARMPMAFTVPLPLSASAYSAGAPVDVALKPPLPLAARHYHDPEAADAVSDPPVSLLSTPDEAREPFQSEPRRVHLEPSVVATLPPVSRVPPQVIARPSIQPALFRAEAISALSYPPPPPTLAIVPVPTPMPAATVARHAPATVTIVQASPPRAMDMSLMRAPDLALSPALAIPEAVALAPREPQRSLLSYLLRGLKLIALAVAGWLALVVLLIFAYRFVDPPFSTLMATQFLTGQSITQEWIPLEDISPQVVRAVLVSEDGRFCEHYGIDYDAIQDAIESAGDGVPRGASTISMQVVKNLYLWPSKSYVRKAIEVPLTYLMEMVWPKWRIMEVYLNVAEWGPGIFGVEAASRYHFDKAASRLSEREAARLAVALPNPIRRDAGAPGPMTLRLAASIQRRMRAASSAQISCVLPQRRN